MLMCSRDSLWRSYTCVFSQLCFCWWIRWFPLLIFTCAHFSTQHHPSLVMLLAGIDFVDNNTGNTVTYMRFPIEHFLETEGNLVTGYRSFRYSVCVFTSIFLASMYLLPDTLVDYRMTGTGPIIISSSGSTKVAMDIFSFVMALCFCTFPSSMPA